MAGCTFSFRSEFWFFVSFTHLAACNIDHWLRELGGVAGALGLGTATTSREGWDDDARSEKENPAGCGARFHCVLA
jgi:hypothetical protein